MIRLFPFSRFWVLGLVALAGSVAGTLWVVNTRAGAAKETTPAPLGRGEQSVVCIGHVDVDGGITSLYPTQPGRVAEVFVHDDETVKAGTVLFRLDDRPARFLLRQAEQELKEAQLQLDNARKAPQQHEIELSQQRQAIKALEYNIEAERAQLTRLQNLQKSKLGPVEDLEAQTAKVHGLEASLAAQREQLRKLELRDPAIDVERAQVAVTAKATLVEQAQYAVNECSVKAPADGKLLRVLVNPGEVLGNQPRQPAVQFCLQAPRIIRGEVEQEFAGRVAVGQVASIQDDRIPGAAWKGKVTRISDWYTHRRSILQEPLQFNDVRTLECIIGLDPGQPEPKIGQRVRVTLGQSR
jgi:multidrug resistance efflux pump